MIIDKKENMKLFLAILLLLLAPVAYAQSSTADTAGATLHPVYISLAYTCVPALSTLSSLCLSIGSLFLCTPLCPFALFFFCSSGFMTILTLPVVYGFPLMYSCLGVLGGNPNFLIGGLGDLFGHFLVDLGSTLSLLVLCLPLGSFLISCGDLVTLCGNGLSVVVVGDVLTALQQFFGATILAAITLCNVLNLFCCCCFPCSYTVSLISALCTNCAALGTDALGQVITYCKPLCSACTSTLITRAQKSI